MMLWKSLETDVHMKYGVDMGVHVSFWGVYIQKGWWVMFFVSDFWITVNSFIIWLAMVLNWLGLGSWWWIIYPIGIPDQRHSKTLLTTIYSIRRWFAYRIVNTQNLNHPTYHSKLWKSILKDYFIKNHPPPILEGHIFRLTNLGNMALKDGSDHRHESPTAKVQSEVGLDCRWRKPSRQLGVEVSREGTTRSWANYSDHSPPVGHFKLVV